MDDRRGSNRLVLALWGFGIVGVFVLLWQAWTGPLTDRDFVAVWIAGKLAVSGHAVQAYDVETLRAAGVQIAGVRGIKLAYPYPPHALFVAAPLSVLPLWVSYVTWQAISAVLFWIAARRYFPTKPLSVLAVLTPAALINVLFGQVGLFFGALWLFAFNGSSLAASALTFKPHLGALAGVEVLRKRRVLVTVALAFGMFGLSALVFGIGSWRAWLTGALSHQVGDLTSTPFGVWHYQMVTPFLAYGLVGWAAFAAAAIFLLTRRFDVFTSATAALLVAPYGFHYDMTVVCLGFGLLLLKRWQDMPAWQTFVCAVVFLLPLLVVFGTWAASPLLLAGLYVQTKNPIMAAGVKKSAAEEPELAGAV